MRGREMTFRRKLMTAVVSVTVPLIVLLLVSNFYSTEAFNSKLADSNLREMNYRAGRIEDGLEAVDDLLVGTVAGSADFMTLSRGVGQLQAHLASYTLYNQLHVSMPAYGDVGAFFIYSATSNTWRDMFTAEFAYAEKTAIRAFVRDAVETGALSYNMGWRYTVLEGRAYLLRFYGGRGTYLAALLPLERLADTSELHIDNEAVALFANEENEPLTATDFIEAQHIDLAGDYEGYFLSGSPDQYMIVGRDIRGTNCRLVLAVSGAGYLDGLDAWQIALLGLSLLAVVLIPLLQLRLTRSILKPVAGLRATMEQIRAGDLEAKAGEQSDIREFREVSETFNTMMTQIKDLRIESYEKALESQRAEMRYLQLQIRPHFFLNCLKSLYALAESGKYDRIQKMILAFSRHIRYIFTDSLAFVPLSRELDHIRNYMQIQRGSSQFPPVCRIEADPALENLPIPPLSLQTFVENAVKHGYLPDRPLEIDVRARVLRSGVDLFADLTVSDNGPGFSDEAIRALNAPDEPVYAQEHIGIQNLKRRMSLIYGDGVLYGFFNSEVGAVAEIFVPIQKESLENGFADAKTREGESE